MSIKLTAHRERWELAKPFTISRGSKTFAETVVVTVESGAFIGCGECVPYARYGESAESVLAQISSVASAVEGQADRMALQGMLPAGAARNAIDCALWDLSCKQQGKDIWQVLDLPHPSGVSSMQTICFGPQGVMEDEARNLCSYPVIKVKLDACDVVERIAALNRGAPNSRLVIDANEGWTIDLLNDVAPVLAGMKVIMIEQPLPAGEDVLLSAYCGAVPLGADESCHTCADLDNLSPSYGYVNIKLDKAGGLTESLRLLRAAREKGFGVMVGSMVSTSLALLPALPLAAQADLVDLDSSNLLKRDREGGLHLDNGLLSGTDSPLWGCRC